MKDAVAQAVKRPTACPKVKINVLTMMVDIVAAATSSAAVQEAVVDSTHAFLTNGQNSIPFGTKYIVTGPNTGLWIGNKNRASVGSHFALMALKQGTWYTSSE